MAKEMRRDLFVLLADRCGLGPKRGSFLAAAELVEQGGVVLEARGIRCGWSGGRLLNDLEAALEQRLGLGVAALSW